MFFQIPLCQTEGFIRPLADLLGLNLPGYLALGKEPLWKAWAGSGTPE
jgi:hypothetical protein